MIAAWLDRLMELVLRPVTLASELGRRAGLADRAIPAARVEEVRGGHGGRRAGRRSAMRTRASDLAHTRGHGVAAMARRAPAGRAPRHPQG